MRPEFDFSIIVSSYNRDDKILETLKLLFVSDLDSFQKIELIVIDDGSPRPVAEVLPQIEKEIPVNIELRLITQNNSGIGATRNRGFREANANVVVLLDDDILLKKDTLKNFLKTLREDASSDAAVIFGSYPFVSHESESLQKFARNLYGYNEITEEPHLEKVNALTSGLLLIDKAKFGNSEYFYKDEMTVPAAEEHEVIARFHKMQIPIYHAKHIFAIHNHHLELKWLAEQQYKYGLATAEAFTKKPEITEMKKFGEMKKKLNFLENKSAKNLIKAFLSSAAGRKVLAFLACSMQRLFSRANHDFVFGMLTSSYFWAGYREGIKRFVK